MVGADKEGTEEGMSNRGGGREKKEMRKCENECVGERVMKAINTT